MTPEKAKALLGKNTHNRPANRKHVEMLAADMKAGRWKLNGDAIRVASNGRVIDGQHRLMACVKSGLPFKTLLVTGLSADVFDTIDTGKRRGAADTFAVKGEKHYSLLAAALAIVELYYSGRATGRLTIKGRAGGPATNQDFEEWLKQYPALRPCVEFCHSKTTRLVQPSIVTACHYIFSRVDSVRADDFIMRLTSGENIAANSPMSKLRAKLLENFTSTRKMERSAVFSLIIKAWNAERTGKDVKRLRAKYDSSDVNEVVPQAL